MDGIAIKNISRIKKVKDIVLTSLFFGFAGFMLVGMLPVYLPIRIVEDIYEKFKNNRVFF